MKKIFVLSVFFIVFISSASARKPRCGSYELGEDFSLEYCLYLTDRTQNSDIVFYLHGRGGSEESWSGNYGKKVEKYWKSNNIIPPTIVAITFGPQWFLTEFPMMPGMPPLQGVYTELLIPNFEAMLGGLGNGRRLLVGESMGGYNSSMLFLKRPDLFEKVAILCPAISTLTPFSTDREVQDYIDRNNADPKRVNTMMSISRMLYTTQERWLTHSPLDLARTNTSADSPALYLSCGDKDEYGFYEGTVLFSGLVDDNEVNLQWVPIAKGVHCTVEPTSLGLFLTTAK